MKFNLLRMLGITIIDNDVPQDGDAAKKKLKQLEKENKKNKDFQDALKETDTEDAMVKFTREYREKKKQTLYLKKYSGEVVNTLISS